MEAFPFLRGALLVVLVLASAIFSSSESALFTLGLYRVRRLKGRWPKAFLSAQRLLREPSKLITTLLIGNEFVNASIGLIGSSIVYDLFEGKVPTHYLPILAVACVLPFVILFGEIFPKLVGIRSPEMVTVIVSGILLRFSAFVSPLRNGLTWLTDQIFFFFGTASSHHESGEDFLRSMVDTGTEEGVLGVHEQKLIHNVFQLDDLKVSEIMKPATSVISLRENTPAKDALKQFESERYSRVPVLDQSGKEVVGVVYLKDLVGRSETDLALPVSKFHRAPLRVSPKASALDLFTQFRTHKTHFAVVVEPVASSVQGVVTLDDVLGRIFGKLRDERDVEEGATSKP